MVPYFFDFQPYIHPVLRHDSYFNLYYSDSSYYYCLNCFKCYDTIFLKVFPNYFLDNIKQAYNPYSVRYSSPVAICNQ